MASMELQTDQDELSGGAKALLGTARTAFFCLRAIIVLLLILYVLSGPFGLEPGEAGLVLRFGAITGDVRVSGTWHWAYPKPIDEVLRFPVQQSNTVSTGSHFFYQEQQYGAPEQQQQLSNEATALVPGTDGYLLTADANMMHAKWQLTYFIDNPIDFYTRFADPDDVIGKVFANTILKATAATPVTAALYGDTEGLRLRVEEAMQKAVNDLQVGVSIRNVAYTEKLPPKTSILAFRRVIDAGVERSSKVNEAQKYQRTVVQQAQGEAAQILAAAEAYRIRIAAEVQAEEQYFLKILAAYEKEPQSAIMSLHANALSQILANLQNPPWLVPAGSDKREIRLNLNGRRKVPGAASKADSGNHPNH